MDDGKQASNGGEPALQHPPHLGPPRREEPPHPFIPLKLTLQPSGPVLELTRSDVLAGRHSEADIRLPLPDVSRRHCRFVFTDTAWEVFDLNSLNGVFVNDRRVQHAILHDHDRLTIGGFRFTVDLSGNAADAGHSPRPEEVIHRIADALPRISPDIDSQRKAS